MAGIFPEGGALPGIGNNGSTPTITPPNGCEAKYYSERCTVKPEARQMNAIISEIIEVMNCRNLQYNCATNDNLARAICSLAQGDLCASPEGPGYTNDDRILYCDGSGTVRRAPFPSSAIAPCSSPIGDGSEVGAKLLYCDGGTIKRMPMMTSTGGNKVYFGWVPNSTGALSVPIYTATATKTLLIECRRSDGATFPLSSGLSIYKGALPYVGPVGSQVNELTTIMSVVAGDVVGIESNLHGTEQTYWKITENL
jgi:hypothetical protein